MSFLRYYDEAVINYFKSINFQNAVEGSNPTPQITFAIPSRKGVKLNIHPENLTPLLPLISITQINLSSTGETNIVKSRVTRPFVYKKDETDKYYYGVELMPYNINYQVDVFSILQNEHNSLREKILYNLHKKNYIKVELDVNNINISVNGYIYNISTTDSTSYNEIPDTSERLFHDSFSFSLYGFLLNSEYKEHTVLDIEYEIADVQK